MGDAFKSVEDIIKACSKLPEVEVACSGKEAAILGRQNDVLRGYSTDRSCWKYPQVGSEVQCSIVSVAQRCGSNTNCTNRIGHIRMGHGRSAFRYRSAIGRLSA